LLERVKERYLQMIKMRVNLLEVDPMKKKRANHERLLKRIENKQK